jgi:hypothetical protein
MTKYKRSYYVDKWTQACFNQKEIGADLANVMLKMVDPTQLFSSDPSSEKTDSARLAFNQPDEKMLIKLYKKPLKIYAIFPGISRFDALVFHYFILVK